MSKQSEQAEAKLAQGYQDKPNTCATCVHRTFEMVLPAWMVEINRLAVASGKAPEYGDQYKSPKNVRCGIGGFAVKAMAFCRKHEA